MMGSRWVSALRSPRFIEGRHAVLASTGPPASCCYAHPVNQSESGLR
jgi:hypothetical protein